ncbi:MAG: anaerobic glycerol-3-phosphate dehydrogenase subunit C, partial [Halorubrum sp.]
MTRHTEDDGAESSGDNCGGCGSPSPGVPEAGRDEQPSIFVPDEGEVPEADAVGGRDATGAGGGTADRAATDGGVESATGGTESATGGTESATGGTDSTELDPDAYDPVDVFPGGDL